MSISLVADESSQELCSNRGWGDFSRWVDSLDSEMYSAVSQLVTDGWYEPGSEVAEDIAAALEDFPPDADVLTVAQELARIAGATETLVVSDGLVPDDGEE